MKKEESGEQKVAYVDTPKGIFSASGHWFRATAADLQAYAGPVLDREPLPALIGFADVWLRSSRTLALWAMPVLLLILTPLQAALAGLGLYLVWKTFSPAMASRVLGKAFRILEHVYLQGLYYVFVLSVLASSGHVAAMWTGLASFIVLRWGLLERLVAPVTERLHRALFALPVPDQVLRAFIVRAALKHRVSLPELDRMERRILQTWNRNKGEHG
ncbi:hypothetical protein [Rhodocaloribacter sp.]